MELPFTIVFEPPSWRELRAQLRMRGYWAAGMIVALTIGSVYLLANVAHADAGGAGLAIPLAVTSQPAGAAVLLDGQQRGVTPVHLTVETGAHHVVLRAPGALEGDYTVDVSAADASLDAVLWRRQADVVHLKPTLPGATLSDVRLLDSGQLGLVLGLPPGRELQAWRLDPGSGQVERVLANAVGTRMAFAADGRRLAFLGSEIGPPQARSVSGAADLPVTLVWFAAADGGSSPAYAWRAPLEASEQLVDVSWSPTADHLLVVTRKMLGGGAVRSRVWLLDSDAQHAQQLVSLPTDVVPGSAAWSADGRAIAFVAHTGEVNALCLIQTNGEFRYVADLEPSPVPPPYPAVAWSANGQQIAFIAPHQHPPGSAFNWLQPDPRHAIYVDRLDQPLPQSLGDTDADVLTWREDGELLGVGHASAEGPLEIRQLNAASGSTRVLLDLPLRTPRQYAAAWGTRHARMLIASQAAPSAVDYWLVNLGLDGSL